MYFRILASNKLICILVCVFISFAACKKKKDNESAPTPTPPTPVPSAMTATVNGKNWQMENSTYSGYKSSGYYGFSGATSSGSPNTRISLTFQYAIGTLTVGGGFGATYKDSTDAYHYAQTGTLSITQLDTNGFNGLASRIKATYTFVTTTSLTISNGVIDWTKPN
jgi:hypothetical protein